MVQAVSYNTEFDFAPAFAGMPADAQITDKISVPCGATAVPFGAVVLSDAATGRSVAPSTANAVPQGIAIHDHNMAGRFLPNVAGAADGYVQYDAIAVMRRGRIWARASGACTKDAVAKYDPATGLWADAGTATFPGARFLTANISIVPVIAGEAAHSIVMVELGDPTVDSIGAS